LNKGDISSKIEEFVNNLTQCVVCPWAVGKAKDPLMLTPHREQVEYFNSWTTLYHSTPAQEKDNLIYLYSGSELTRIALPVRSQ